MGAPSLHNLPFALISDFCYAFEIQGCKFMSSVCVHIYSTRMLTSVPQHVCVLCNDVTVEPPLGRLPLLLFELNPL